MMNLRFIIVLSAILVITFGENIDQNNRAIVREANVRDGTFVTPLDHFLPTDGRRITFSYQSNAEFYKDGGPIFLYINDGAGVRWITSGLVYDIARELNGGLVTASTRYFGQNTFIPTTTENLRYLTIDNMLGDVAHLVAKVRQDYNATNARIIVWGTRLGATTAALARKKFPHLIQGVWASSGLFRAFIPDTSYYRSVSANIHQHGSARCAGLLSHVFNTVRNLVESRNGARLSQLFNLCAPLNFANRQSIAFFYVNVFRFVANHVETEHFNGIQQLCKNVAIGVDPLESFIRWVNYEYPANGACRNIHYETWLERRRETGIRNMGRATTWYYCTQFAFDFFVTTADMPGRVFPNVVDEAYYNNLCTDVFGVAMFNRTILEGALDNFNIQHGSQNQVVTNAIFSHGGLDPLLDHGMVQHRHKVSEMVLTRLHGVEADLTSVSGADSVELRATKTAIRAALRRFAMLGTRQQELGEIAPAEY